MIALASDHAGFEMKQEIGRYLEELKLPFKDLGVPSGERADYPKYGYLAAKAVASGECDKGIIICGTGFGISLAANKVKGIRAVVCTDCYTALLSRQHNNANILALGARVIAPDAAKLIIKTWLQAEFEGGRHQGRLDMITKIEEGKIDFIN
ncbi:ribose-5-phosphate isomerase B [Treponema primitia ZAS-2]|uniref:Ribose-5-phosphate isomerase B n=1 Tax=Treponema primitia (strain ATCC BAA-887 / DSM 12427 / ZAS-2) TaxID=545694 RepID=F5YKJ1_TREPZ|nr:ribose 5-phosphate isomerase B [Treponema primitia]AEF84164.1 ribose-5-phosphate isomerase B [Treponema primitia ZAS-2]